MKKTWTLLWTLCATSTFAQTPVFQATFDDSSDLLKATYGKNLVMKGTEHKAVAGPTASDGAVTVPKDCYYEVDLSDVPAIKSQGVLGTWSLVMDIKLPNASDGVGGFYSLYQTSTDNANDADCFIRSDGTLGTADTGYTSESLTPNVWHRVAIVMDTDNHICAYYIDGEEALNLNSGGISIDSRFSINEKLLLFADDDGECGKLDVAAITLYDVSLTADQCKALDTIQQTAEKVVPNFEYDFNDPANLLKATHGKDLIIHGTHTVTDGPATGNGAVTVPKNTYYEIDLSNLPEYETQSSVATYTLVMDIRFPDKSDGVGGYFCLFQTDPNNLSDGDCFIMSDGTIGTYETGYTKNQFKWKEWYRVAFVFNEGKTSQTVYIDGVKAHTAFLPYSVIQGGRFSLDKKILLFADDDGECGTMDVAKIAFYNKALTSKECKELGGYGHEITMETMAVTPFLYDPSTTTARISWHDAAETPGVVEYGKTTDLGSTATSTCISMDGEDYNWHTVKLTDLEPGTVYYYRVKGNTMTTDMYSLKTLPANDKLKKIRFLTMGDTHSNTTETPRILAAAQKKLTELYGNDPHVIDMILHTGDITNTGSNISDYTTLLFQPFAAISPYVPMLAVIGNHDWESKYFYNYFQNDDITAQPANTPDYRRYWSKRIGNVLLLGLNSNSTGMSGMNERQLAWVSSTLDNVEKDNTIDMVFVLVHECPVSELWATGMNGFVHNQLYPLLRKYPKVHQISYGHTHGYERGAALPYSDESTHDMTILCDGVGGGYLDRYTAGNAEQVNRAEISRSYDQWGFIVGEIDFEKKSYTFDFYSIGNSDRPLDTVLTDHFYGSINQPAPNAPTGVRVEAVNANTRKVTCDPFVGEGKLYSSEIQLLQHKNGADQKVLMTVIRDDVDIFGTDKGFMPVNWNQGINLLTYEAQINALSADYDYAVRVRFRDDNRKWSPWSNNVALFTDLNPAAEKNVSVFCEKDMSQIHLILPEEGTYSLKIYDMNGHSVVDQTVEGQQFTWSYKNNPKGVYMLSVSDGHNNYKAKIIAR